MKKILALLLAMALALPLAACGGNNTEPTPSASQGSDVTEPQENVEAEPQEEDVLDKNDTSNYVGEWETETYRLDLSKGGVGSYERLHDKDYKVSYDLEWEVTDEVLVTKINFSGMEHKAVLELSDDGSSLTAVKMGFPQYIEGEYVFTKKP